MDHIESYRTIILNLLNDLAASFSVAPGIEKTVIADTPNDNYMLLCVGWAQHTHTLHIVVYFRIRNGKIWIEANDGIDSLADDLESAGVPKSAIVLGFVSEFERAFSAYAAA